MSVIPKSTAAGGTPSAAGGAPRATATTAAATHALPRPVSWYLEIKQSAELIFASRLTWFLIAGPLALAGSATGALPESTCFALAGLALIPCAERLSFVTEQVAAHTNGTIGALLNASFGNAPELLISSAALRAGFYRVVQLAMLGSILCNLLFVFGISCFIGGLRWQVQDLRIVSGSVPIAILLLSTAGVALPAALKVSGQIADLDGDGDIARELIGISRFNALVMMFAYLAYLVFQLGTHKEEYDDSEEEHERLMHHGGGDGPAVGAWRKRKAKRNIFCRGMYRRGRSGLFQAINTEEPAYDDDDSETDLEMARRGQRQTGELPFRNEYIPEPSTTNGSIPPPQSRPSPPEIILSSDGSARTYGEGGIGSSALERQSSLRSRTSDMTGPQDSSSSLHATPTSTRNKLRASDGNLAVPPTIPASDNGDSDSDRDYRQQKVTLEDFDLRLHEEEEEDLMTFRTGIVWLFIITLCISSLSDILVESIDGFASKMHISEVFTSVIVLPFFSNIAEQVSAVIFAYRNEMDLCVGVTVGSAAQIALMVLPGCVLVGWIIDRSMSMYVHGYETCCLLIGTLLASAVLLGGTTNWVTGFFFIVVYLMMAAGFWFHELEELDVDAEEFWHSHNGTSAKAVYAFDKQDASF